MSDSARKSYLPQENWNIREDVAGYEFPQAGLQYRIGVARQVIQTPADIDPLFEVLATPFDVQISRNMVRAVVTKELLLFPPPSLRSLLSSDLEVIISLELSGNPDLADCYQVIFGRNHASRQTPQSVIAEELAAAERVFAAAKTKPFSLAFLSQLRETYSIGQVMAASDPELVEAYRVLAQATFHYESEDLDMLLDEDTLIAAAVSEQGGQRILAGGAFGWRDTTYLKRGGRDVTLNTYELTGAVVREEHSGKGLIKALSVILSTLLAQRTDPIDVAFGFVNIRAFGLLSSAAQTACTMVTETARELHLPLKPAIQQNRVRGAYVDDIVTYIPGESLRSRFRALETL